MSNLSQAEAELQRAIAQLAAAKLAVAQDTAVVAELSQDTTAQDAEIARLETFLKDPGAHRAVGSMTADAHARLGELRGRT